MTELTLKVDEAIVEKATRYAADHNTSVSELFADFVLSLTVSPGSTRAIGPLTRKATGLAKVPADKDYGELLTEALMDKHGLSE